MNEPMLLACMALVGAILGAIFYGGLWWTVRHRPGRLQGIWFVGSFLLRAAIAVGGLYGLGRGDWRSWLASLAGFLAARLLITRAVGTLALEDAASPLVREP